MFVSIWRLGWPCRRARKADDVVCCKSPFRQLKIKKPAARRSHKTDRKSTRLNSSHGYISYAVFCLKNKKNKSATTGSDNNTSKKDNILSGQYIMNPVSFSIVTYYNMWLTQSVVTTYVSEQC